MIDELHVRDLALIDEAWLEFCPGMTVLTGETGAGKTALLSALKLLLGERADSNSVRAGASEAMVEGRFSANECEFVVRRRVSSDGRSRCTLDGEMATVSALANTVGPLVDLHGQHEHQALLSASTHAGYLDRWAGRAATEARDAYATALEGATRAAEELAAVEARIAEALRNSDYLRFVVDEIGRVDPKSAEDTELETRLPALQHAEKLAEAASAAARALRADDGALDRIGEASVELSRVAGIDSELDALAERLKEAQALVDEAGMAARSYRDRLERDPEELDRTLARLATLTGLKRKYGPALEDVIRTWRESELALQRASESDEAFAGAAEALEQARANLHEAGERLAQVRLEASPSFSAALDAATSDLAMSGCGFEVRAKKLPFEEWTSSGPQRIEFLYRPGPGQPYRSLAKVASGGEISRVMLALKGVLGRADTVETLVFDEIDAGIGGSTAQAVGRRLATLAASHQVIVVTHLAQVAAYADRHLVVHKEVSGDSVTTTVRPVEGEDRVGEVARMLSGNDSETSRAHARELLQEAEPTRRSA